MQNTTGKLMERIVARKLAQDLERRNVLPLNQEGYRAGKTTCENAARFAYDVYEGFRRKEQTLAVAVDLEDAYNRLVLYWPFRRLAYRISAGTGLPDVSML